MTKEEEKHTDLLPFTDREKELIRAHIGAMHHPNQLGQWADWWKRYAKWTLQFLDAPTRKADCHEELNALRAIMGKSDDENIGWRGVLASDANHFQCEFCRAEDLDCTKIPHNVDCPIVGARKVLARATNHQESGEKK